MAEEKLDGVFTLWTGQRLVTKTGHPVAGVWTAGGVDASRLDAGGASRFRATPSALPVCGRIVPRKQHAVARGQARPHKAVGAPHPALFFHPNFRNTTLWSRARLVAFDVPGCQPSDLWTYDARYTLLHPHRMLCTHTRTMRHRHVVAAWNHRQTGYTSENMDRLPLQLIGRFPMIRVSAGFPARPRASLRLVCPSGPLWLAPMSPRPLWKGIPGIDAWPTDFNRTAHPSPRWVPPGTRTPTVVLQDGKCSRGWSGGPRGGGR